MIKIDDGAPGGVSAPNLLEALDKARVLNVQRYDGRFAFEEGCDNWFCAYLTKDQLLALAEELRMLATQGDDQP